MKAILHELLLFFIVVKSTDLMEVSEDTTSMLNRRIPIAI